MAAIEKLYLSILSGMQDKNIKFRDLQKFHLISYYSAVNVLSFPLRLRSPPL